MLTDPLTGTASVYAVASLFLRLGNAVLPSRLDPLIADASSVVTLALVVIGGFVGARRMLRSR